MNSVVTRHPAASLLASLLLFSSPLFAANQSEQRVDKIEAFQSPLWVENSNGITAGFAGQALGPNDTIRTGPNGKVLLRLADGSVVKLGNGAVLKRDIQGFDASASVAPSTALTNKVIASETAPNQAPVNQVTASPAASAEPVEKDLYRGALAVVEGAFRYSTTLLSAQYRRALTIKTGNVATIGIRGTDLWGRVTSDSSFVALIEGNIGITTTDGTETRLDKPLLAFQADQNSPSGKRFAVELEDVLALAPETELDQGEGILVKNGPFAVHLTSFSHEGEAVSLRNQLLKQGYAADTSNFSTSQQPWFRVSVRGFASLADARSFSAMTKAQGMANSPWVDNNH